MPSSGSTPEDWRKSLLIVRTGDSPSRTGRTAPTLAQGRPQHDVETSRRNGLIRECLAEDAAAIAKVELKDREASTRSTDPEGRRLGQRRLSQEGAGAPEALSNEAAPGSARAR